MLINFVAQAQKLYTWGDNQFGQLGNGTTNPNNIPIMLGTDSNWTKVSISINKSFGIKRNRTLWAWGHNELGTLGDGTYTTTHVPKRIGNDSDWVDVSTYSHHTIALRKDGTLWGWGLNSFGSIGDGTTVNKNFPVKIGMDNNWKTISVGNFHTIALKTDNSLWAWGYNINGELGNGTFAHVYNPIRIGTDNDWVMAVAGANHSAAIKSNGTLWVWGRNSYGALGDGTSINKNVPIQVGTDNNWQFVACSDNSTFAVKTDGSLWAWGSNNNGKLGDGTDIDKFLPVRIGSESTWYKIFPGPSHTMAIKINGTLWGWGLNYVFQIGDGTNIDRFSPVLVSSGDRWVAASPAFSHTVALYGLQLLPEIDAIAPTFTPQVCGSYDKKTFKVYNYGQENLIISNVDITGANQVDFRLINSPLPKTLAPNDTAYFDVEFRPLSSGFKQASLRVQSNDLNDPVYNIMFSAKKDSVVVNPNSKFFDLGVVCTGEDKNVNLQISNQGTVYTAAYLTKSQNLYITDLKLALNAGQTRTITVVFNKKSTEGFYKDTIVIADSSCGKRDTVYYQIRVQNAKFITENSTVETKVGIPKDFIVKLTNQSDRDIIIQSAPSIDPPFSFVSTSFPISIAARASINVIVRFLPTAIGDFSQTIKFDGSPCDIHSMCLLMGRATDTEILSSNPSIDNIICENSKDFEVKLENISDKKWTINDINLSGSDASQFVILESFPFDIAENSEKLVRIQFKPNSIGTKSAAIKFSSNAPNASQITANLSARKDSASISIEESLIDLGTIIVETTKDSSINITNYGNLSNKALISGFNKFEFYQAQANLSASESSKIDFHFAGSDVPTTIEELVEVQDTICGRKHIVRIRVKVRAKDAEPEPDKEPKISASSSISFDDLVCESSSESKLRINSIGDTLLTINSIELNGANSGDFRVEPLAYPFDIDTATYREIKIYFEPTSPGIKTAQLVIKSSAVNDSIITLPLSASKDSMSFELAQRGIDLGSIEINNTKDSTIKVTNTSTRRANFTLNATANITLSSTTFSLEPSESRTIDFTFNGLPTVEEIREQITVLETTCGDSAKVFVSGSTYEVIIELPAECAIKVHQDSAKSGERINIKISIEDKKYFTYYKIDTIRVELVYNSTVLAPIGYPYYDINDTLAYINVPLYKNDIDNGKLVLFDVGLGNTEISNLTLRNPKFDVQDDDILYQLSSSNFTLLGLCKEGGTRLTQRTGKGGIINISPNPANAVSSITYAPIELGQTKIELFNVFGEKVASIMDKNISKLDNLEIIFDTREISSGTYFIRYSSATASGSEMLIIKR